MADSSLASKSRRREPSPPKQPAGNRKTSSQSLLQQTRRSGRTLRSQSREIVDDDGARNVGRGLSRGVRQASTESAGSGQGSDATKVRQKGKGKGKGKAMRAGTGVGDLSTVAEDPPVEYPDLERHTPHGNDRQDVGEADVQVLGEGVAAETDEDGPKDTPESPTAFSTISGTTARTSHSAQELADLDAELILEVLPSLSDTSSRLLGVLVPAGATREEITNITRQLLLPGSKTSRRVKFQESSFQSARGEFGSDQYIDLSIIGRALLGVRLTKDIGTGPWSPDPLLQKANLAIFATRMLVHQRGSQDLWAAVALLDSKFPAPFLSTLESSTGPTIGSSQLLRQTFNLALNLRTQLMLMILSQHAEKPNYDPDAILRYVFFEGDKVKEWTVPGLGGGGSRLPDEFERFVLERIERIRRSFTEPSESLFVAGEPVEMPAELKRLEETFPWIDFLSEVVSWTNLRLEEIERQITGQGGTGAIVLALREEMDRRQNERGRNIGNDEAGGEGGADDEADGERLIDLTFEPPGWKTRGSSDHESVTGGLRLVTEVTQKVPGISYNSPAGVAYLKKREVTLRSVQELKLPGLDTSPSRTIDNQTASVAGPSRQTRTRDSASRADAMTESQVEDDWRPQYDDEEDDENHPVAITSSAPPSSAPLMVSRYTRHQGEKNKENVTLRGTQGEPPKPKKAFIDRQAGAKRVDFSEDLEDSQPTSFQKPKVMDKGKKRARDMEEQMEEGSESDDFEMDNRPIDNRRKRPRTGLQGERNAPLIPASSTLERSQTSRAQRRSQNGISKSSQQHQDEEGPSRHRREIRAIIRASGQDEDSDEADAGSDLRAALRYDYVNTIAKRFVGTKKVYRTQKRRAWTDQEVNRLLELVEVHGPSWAKIEKVGDPILAGRSQVNLKDKARNMKFDFVKAGHDLPVGFDQVRLNRNQINQLHDLGVGYEQ
ncbi:hypothetical protein FGG08_004602 [Glutinoglossum americanum]|uniref:Myb-like domain-containing protein n=1 Tax=Glutinoglossum americanum TaxID=1670608 RepID=A0A9P8I079_9PEZI|nr:hypothetical protein FGG08_004602 [Glutinoglossum americanum]